MLQHIFGYVVPTEILVNMYWLQKLLHFPVMPSQSIKPEPETDIRVYATDNVPVAAVKAAEVQ